MSLLPDVLDRYRRDRTFEIAEVSERQRERLLAELGRQGAQAADFARSASEIASATQDIAVEVSRMAAVADVALPAIVEHLALAAERLGGVEQMLARPEETAAAEFYRNGTYALANGWWEEAVTDLSEAVRLYRYNPRTWFNLGIAQHRHDAAVAAAEAFGRCARYGVSVEPALTARAVLLAAVLHRAAGRIDASGDILRNYADKIDSCAELHLALGVHHHDHDHLVEALSLAPDLVVDARIGKASRLEEAAAAVCQMVDGPVHRLRTIERLTAHVAERARAAGLENVQPPPSPLNLPPDGVDALLLAHDALPKAMDGVTRITTDIRDEYRRRQTAAANATKDSDTARKDALRAVHTLQQMEVKAQGVAANLALLLDAATAAADQVGRGEWHEKLKRAERARDTGRPDWITDWAVASTLAAREAEEADKVMRQAAASLEWAWHSARDLASILCDVDEFQDLRRRFEAEQRRGDDFIAAWKQDVWAPLVRVARPRAQEAQDKSIAMIGLAKETARLAGDAAEVMSEVEANLQTAAQAAAPAQRIVPFDLPGEWNSQFS